MFRLLSSSGIRINRRVEFEVGSTLFFLFDKIVLDFLEDVDLNFF